MSKRYFGTDGIRGPYGGDLINDDFAWRFGYALGCYLHDSSEEMEPCVIIGRDSRVSGRALANAIIDGVSSSCASSRILNFGIVPTPAVALGVRQHEAALGIVLTASHNPAGDNGFKLFSPEGRKLDDAVELRIEALIDQTKTVERKGNSVGVETDGGAAYVEQMLALMPVDCLAGWSVVADTANGATVDTTPNVLSKLGADVIHIGGSKDGAFINDGVGSECPQAMAAKVSEVGARLGIANDGDGDRLVLCDEIGNVLTGDEVMAIVGLHALKDGRLKHNTLVATVMSNLGLDQAMEEVGGRVERVSVGDRYVIERMVQGGFVIGGETSGHFVFSDCSTTGDGLLAALKVIQVMLKEDKPLSVLRRCINLYPQRLCNLRVAEKIPFDDLPGLSGQLAAIEKSISGRGRVMVRYSGTEPKIRILVEAGSEGAVETGIVAAKDVLSNHLHILD